VSVAEVGQAGGSGATACPTRPDPVVIGIDSSLTGTGIASSLGWCALVGYKDVTKMPLAQRVSTVDDLMVKIYTMVGTPDLVVIEVPAFSRAGGGALERGALWWLLVRQILRREIPVAEVFNATRMRYATGKGSAGKNAIVEAATRRWPQFETGGDDNLCDAVVLMAMGADFLGHPLATVPAVNRAALDKVNWPEVLSS
jgi:Holliday junction resolvasome RuvABC endonuclease subunit